MLPPRWKDKWWLLEELAKPVSPGTVGAAKLEEDDEIAKVARKREELEGNFMIKEWEWKKYVDEKK